MAGSRHVWLLAITLLCMAGILAWKSPQAVMVALREPVYADSSQTSIQRFWGYLDTRQLDLAEKMLASELQPLGKHEYEVWQKRVLNNPLLSLRKVEFLKTDNSQGNGNLSLVNVEWTSSLKEKIVETYIIETLPTDEGWKIIQIQKANNDPLA